MGKNPAELVGLDLADESCACAEARHSDDGVRRRAARHLHRRTHGVVNPRRLRLVDQLHGSFAHLLLGEKVVVGARDHVDNGVADAENVETSGGHDFL